MDHQRHDHNGRYRECQIERQEDQIHRKELRSDQLPSKRQTAMILAVAARHGHGIAMLLEKSHHFFVTEWAAQRGLLLFYLRAKIVREFFDDVVALRSRQAAFHCTQITAKDVHHALLKESRSERNSCSAIRRATA